MGEAERVVLGWDPGEVAGEVGWLAGVPASVIASVGLLKGGYPRPAGLVPSVVGVGLYDEVAGRPALKDLVMARAEAEGVADLYGVDPLGADVGRVSVLEALAGSAVLHAAVHVVADPVDPAGSALHLRRERVTVADVIEQDVRGWLAVLSACESARASVGEEQVSLATAMQLAGYTHAIGSVQPVFDVAAAEFMVELHGRLAAGLLPGEALHETREWARGRWPDEPQHWAVWTHIGP